MENPAVSPNNPFLPSKAKIIRERQLPPPEGRGILGGDAKSVTCAICRKKCKLETAHLHSGEDGDEWIGDECCWDDRLHASE